MISLLFKTLRWKNFLSTGNAFTEIQLDKSPSTLIVGDNGSGKSTFLDAFYFVLYGKAFRKIKKDQLINSINQGHAVVEIEFESYGKQYKIIRGIRPNIFEIYQDGQLINQNASARDYQEILERSILKMNEKTCTQIVMGSSTYVPFMQLPPNIRREVIEDLLDIEVFSSMNILLKNRIQNLREKILLHEKDIKNKRAVLKIQEEHMKKLNQDSIKILKDLRSQMETLTTSNLSLDTAVKELMQQVKEFLEICKEKRKIITKLDSLLKIEAKFENKLVTIEKTLKFFAENDHCPTCTQEISETIKETKIIENNDEISKLQAGFGELKDSIQSYNTELNEIHETQSKIDILQNQIDDLQNQITINEREFDFLEKKTKDVDTTTEGDLSNEIDQIKKELKEYDHNHEIFLKRKELYDVASVILRDSGIKSKIIKKYIPVINTLVNKYLASMDFFVKFELDESFNERILSRHRDDFTYDSFSAGERMRIDLALLFTWRTIARKKNSSSTNLLILDEFFDASLDGAGCDEFLKIIQSLDGVNVFIISHKGDVLQDKFRSSIRFEKHNNFSRIV